MEKDKSIDVLNDLITINNDRIQGYQTASDETDEQDLQSLFNGFIQTSQKCKAALSGEVIKLGGKPAEGTRVDGKIYRLWMDVKAAVAGKDRKTILNSCEYGEDVAVHTYQKALEDKNNDLGTDLHSLINQQYSMIKADHDTVKEMRDALVDVS